MIAAIGHFMASDSALMVLSMMFGLLVGMLWSGRAFPRRLPRALVRDASLRR